MTMENRLCLSPRLLAAVSPLPVSALAHPGRVAIWPRPASARPSASDDEFGVEITLPEKTIVYLHAAPATWDTAYETLVEAFRPCTNISTAAG